MINIATAHLIYIFFLGISSLLLTKFTILNKLFALLMPIHFMTQKKETYSSLRLFAKIKAVLVLIPLFLFLIMICFPV